MATKNTTEDIINDQVENTPAETIETPSETLETPLAADIRKRVTMSAGDSYLSVAERLTKGDSRQFAEKLAEANLYTPTAEGVVLVVPN